MNRARLIETIIIEIVHHCDEGSYYGVNDRRKRLLSMLRRARLIDALTIERNRAEKAIELGNSNKYAWAGAHTGVV